MLIDLDSRQRKIFATCIKIAESRGDTQALIHMIGGQTSQGLSVREGGLEISCLITRNHSGRAFDAELLILAGRRMVFHSRSVIESDGSPCRSAASFIRHAPGPWERFVLGRRPKPRRKALKRFLRRYATIRQRRA